MFLCLLIIANSAVWVYFDASRLRDSHHTGVGPLGVPPQTWAAMTFLLWPLAFPYYLSKRQEVELLEERPGPPPRFVTEGLTALAVIVGLIGFIIFGGLLAIGELQWSIVGLVVAAVGIFGGRKTHMTKEQEQVDLGSIAFDQIGFSAPAAAEHDGGDGDEPVDLDRYFSSMGQAPAQHPAQPTAPRPTAQPQGPGHGIPYAPAQTQVPVPDAQARPAPPQAAPPQAAPPQAPRPPVPQPPVPQPPTPHSTQQPPATQAFQAQTPPAVAGSTPEPAPGVPYSPPAPGQPYTPPPVQAPGSPLPTDGPRATVALSPEALQRHASGLASPPVPTAQSPIPQAPRVPPVDSSPSVQMPENPSLAVAPASGPAVPPPNKPLPAPPRRNAPPPPRPRSAASPNAPARPVGSYAYAAKADSSIPWQRIMIVAVAIGLLGAVGWLAQRQFGSSAVEDAPVGDTVPMNEEVPAEEPTASSPQAEPPAGAAGRPRAGGVLPPKAETPSSGPTTQRAASEVPVSHEALDEWTAAYSQWMTPLALQLDEIDFEGIAQSRCRKLQKALRAVQNELPECPDTEIQGFLDPALTILRDTADACRAQDENLWASGLLEAKRLIHEAQVLLDERYRFAGISELELESAIGVQRSPDSISGKWLQARGEQSGTDGFDDFPDDDGNFEDGSLEDDFEDFEDEEPDYDGP